LSWITVIWSMLASACLTLALVHSLIWWGKREAPANALFVLLALATIFYSACEFAAMRSTTVDEYGRILRWGHLPFFVAIVSLVAFVRVYLRAGRSWLAWLICGLGALALLLNFIFTPNLNYRKITALRQIHFFGEPVSFAVGVPNPWMLIGQASLLLLVVFTLDATRTIARRGGRRHSLFLMYAITLFVALGSTQAILIFWAHIACPLTPSLFFWGIVLAMGLELGWDVIHASNLAGDLLKSERRLRTILEQAPLAINISRDGVSLYANQKFKQMFGLPADDPVAGQSILEYFAPAVREEARERVRQRSLGLPVPSEYESIGIRADGSPFPMHLTVGQVHLADGHANVGFVSDITERRRAETELASRQQFTADLIEHSHLQIHVKDLAGRYTLVNQKAGEAIGRTRESILGRTDHELFPAADAGRLHQNDLATLAAEKALTFEETLAGTAQPRTFITVKMPVRDGHQQITGVCGMSMEITERKRAEEEVLLRTAFFEALLNSTQDAILVVDNQNQKVIQNQRMGELWKIPPEIASHPDDRRQYEFARSQTLDPAAFDEKSRSLAANPDAHARDEIVLKDGTVLERQTALINGPNGREYGRLWNFRDITAAKQAEASLTLLATAVEQSAEAILITDSQGVILYVNPAFEKTTGYTRAEAIGRNPRILKSDRHDAAFYRQMWDVLARGEVWHGRFINRHRNGTLHEENAIISPVRDSAGKVINYVAVKRDVTREIQLEAELRQAQKLEAIGQLAGGVAHDFNNILASILLQVGLLSLEDHLSPVVMEGLLQIQADSERAANLTRQLLLFSRRQVMQPRILDLNEQVTGLVKMLTRIIGEDMRMELHLHPAPLLTHADAGMLDQVLMNLVVNSRDAMPDGGRVRVETSAKVVGPGEPLPHLEASPGQFVCLAVSDTGTGIPPEILPRIFEPFFTTKPEGKGTGMGLATVYGIVKQHKGWIQVQSQSGQGATFQVFLPLGNSPAEAARGSGNVPPPRGSETILLVEDEPGLLHLSHSILERHGYQVLTAANAQEAFNQWRQHRARVTLLLTDLVMPGGCNGLELARRLRSEKPLLKVIFASGYSASIASQDFKLLPGEALLQKPFGTNQLLAMVRESLDSVNPGRAPVSGLSPSFPKPSPPPVRL